MSKSKPNTVNPSTSSSISSVSSELTSADVARNSTTSQNNATNGDSETGLVSGCSTSHSNTSSKRTGFSKLSSRTATAVCQANWSGQSTSEQTTRCNMELVKLSNDKTLDLSQQVIMNHSPSDRHNVRSRVTNKEIVHRKSEGTHSAGDTHLLNNKRENSNNELNDLNDSSESVPQHPFRSRKANFLESLSNLRLNNQPMNYSSIGLLKANTVNDSLEPNKSSTSYRKFPRAFNLAATRNNCQMYRSSISSTELNYSSANRASSLLAGASCSSSSGHCCHNHNGHSHYQNHYQETRQAMDPIIQNTSSRTQPCQLMNQQNQHMLDISSIEATSIISKHCNTENSNTAAPFNSSAITTLTASSSSGLPVSALTVMESPNLSSSHNGGSYNWQAFMSTLKDRMATIFNCELLADVHFIVGKGDLQTRFPAHKFVLSIGSAVFDAMFNGPLAKANKESNSSKCLDSAKYSNSDSEIELPDIEPEAFQALLRFLYLDEVQIGPETVMTTLYAAKKYEIPALELACVNFLKANLSPENAFMLLTQARLFDEAPLADLCLETIDKHTMDSIHSDSFFEIDLDTLKMLLRRDSLRVREMSLFVGALRWAEFECTRQSLEPTVENKRTVLGDALYLIRFPLMDIEEFAHNVAQSGLLTDKEVVNLFLHFTVSSKPLLPFSIEPRCWITGEECSVSRFQRTESRWGYSGTSDRIRFLTDRPIFVIGFGLFGSIHGPSKYEAIIEIIHTGSGKVIASNSTSFVSDGSESTFRVMFEYPVEISQNINYTASTTLKGVDSYYGTNGCRTVAVNIGKPEAKETVTFQFSYSAGCNNGTSVEDGQIPEIIFYT